MNHLVINERLFPGNEFVFKELKQFVIEKKIIALTGAGTSAPVYPTWGQLLHEIINFAISKGLINVEDDISEYRRQVQADPLELASSLEAILQEHNFRNFISERFRGKKGGFTEAHKLVCSLNLKGLITTNYDDGIQRAYSETSHNHADIMTSDNKSSITRWIQGEVFDTGSLPILHWHGDVSRPNSMIFTGDDYNKFYSVDLNNRFINHLWLGDRLLVIGYGFADPFFNRVIEQAMRGSESADRHFAIIGCRDGKNVSHIARTQFSKKYRVTPLFYEVRNGENQGKEDHSDLIKILKMLIEVDSPSSENGGSNSEGAGSSDLITPNQPVLNSPIAGSSTSHERREFEAHLFSSPSGKFLYVEPQLLEPQTQQSDNNVEQYKNISVDTIVNNDISYIVSTRSEYGGSTLGRRIHADFVDKGISAMRLDANSVPSYRAKLNALFSTVKAGKNGKLHLILDDFDIDRHERLLKEIISLRIVDRFILISSSSNVKDEILFGNVDETISFRLIILSNLDRSNIRTLAAGMFDSGDDEYLSSIVDKVYDDLLGLCIPLTPANIIMYLQILYKEQDFHPLNRVQIIERYLGEIFRKPSDDFSQTFTSRDKIRFLAEFIYGLYTKQQFNFTSQTWRDACRSYQDRTLVDFDGSAILNDLLNKKLFIKTGEYIYLKYRLFYAFFLVFI